jgi:threonine dehydratase
MIPHEWLLAADSRIRPTALVTPVTEDPRKGIFLKWENHQLTGSFKLRGALNKILTLEPWERERGLVTCSAGNYGQGAAVAANQTKSRLIIFASAHAVPAKIKAMQALGAEVRLVAGGYELAEQIAQEFASKEQMTFVSPYNDGQVIAGQGTICLELARQISDVNAETEIYIPVGGGGLLSGVASVFQDSSNKPKIIGVQSEASPFFHELFTRGSQEGVVETESLADGLAGRVQEGSITIPMVLQLADEILLVSEEDIRLAIRWCWQEYTEKIEGSAATALAAALNSPRSSSKKVVILSGGNIQPEVFEQICAAEGSFGNWSAQ